VSARGVNAAAISGDVAQRERERMVERLRRGGLDVLVATDVAARGIDVDRVGLVVNYDVPRDGEAYVHRIGRTGRAGRAGLAITFVTPGERGKLRAIERRAGAKLAEHAIPSLEQVADQQCADLLRRVPDRLAAGQLEAAYRAVTDAVEDGADPISLAAGLMALAVDRTPGGAGGGEAGGDAAEFDRAMAELRERFDGQDGRGRADRSSRGDRGGQLSRDRGGDHGAPRETRRRPASSRPDAKRYWIAVGHGHGARPGAIVGAITGETRLSGSDLGRIEMFKHFSVVEIGAELSGETMRRLAEARVVGRALRIKPDLGARH
jgi:ATP-dependent RNA helicase DeaD